MRSPRSPTNPCMWIVHPVHVNSDEFEYANFRFQRTRRLTISDRRLINLSQVGSTIHSGSKHLTTLNLQKMLKRSVLDKGCVQIKQNAQKQRYEKNRKKLFIIITQILSCHFQ